MSAVLCETCFPDYGNVEVLTIVPIRPCEGCGVVDGRFKGGPRVHLLRKDPRAPKDREIADFVNELRDVAEHYGQTQQLRERISRVVLDFLKGKP
jgi:hypothetical protein